MKKQILLLGAVAVSTFSFAQVKTSFGVRGGISKAGMRGEAVNNLNNLIDFAKGMISTTDRSGYFAGGFATIPVSPLLSVEPAVYYSQKGYEMKGDFAVKGADFLGANAKAKLTSQYIDMPVVLKANMNGFQVFAGPQISYLAKAELKTTAGVFGFNLLNRSMEATDQFNRWDAAVTGGLGYRFTNGLNITAAYDHGLSKVDANQNMNSYNKAIKVGIGLSF